jgi:hypothetical protein
MSVGKKLVIVGLLIGVVALSDWPRAQGPPAAFYGIGDLPGGGAGRAPERVGNDRTIGLGRKTCAVG